LQQHNGLGTTMSDTDGVPLYPILTLLD